MTAQEAITILDKYRPLISGYGGPTMVCGSESNIPEYDSVIRMLQDLGKKKRSSGAIMQIITDLMIDIQRAFDDNSKETFDLANDVFSGVEKVFGEDFTRIRYASNAGVMPWSEEGPRTITFEVLHRDKVVGTVIDHGERRIDVTKLP